MSYYVGEFHKLHYQPMLKRYAYNIILLCLLGKHQFKNHIREDVLTDKNDVTTERDYAEALNA